MANQELEFLAELASTHKKILEIGSHYGRSTRAMADNTEGVVVACDHFRGPTDVIMCWKDREAIYDAFLKNMGEHIASGKVLPWKANHKSLDIATSPVQPKFDMVFVDGQHDYDSVYRDIQFGLSVLETGGLICGHDYDITSPGVVMAVNGLIDGFTVGENTRIWLKEIH
jgi:predicted O-methyltransferase YrrM